MDEVATLGPSAPLHRPRLERSGPRQRYERGDRAERRQWSGEVRGHGRVAESPARREATHVPATSRTAAHLDSAAARARRVVWRASRRSKAASRTGHAPIKPTPGRARSNGHGGTLGTSRITSGKCQREEHLPVDRPKHSQPGPWAPDIEHQRAAPPIVVALHPSVSAVPPEQCCRRKKFCNQLTPPHGAPTSTKHRNLAVWRQ
jgi:hypothetical protein